MTYEQAVAMADMAESIGIQLRTLYPCGACDGTGDDNAYYMGELSSARPCPDCWGRGWVVVEPRICGKAQREDK